MYKEVEMKKSFFLLSGLFLMLSGIFAEDIRTITVYNNLSDPVYYLYMTPENQGDWGEDRLGDEILDPGESLAIEIDVDFWGSNFRLMAEDETEKAYRIDKIDLSVQNEITLEDSDFLPFGGRSPVKKEITFYNNTDEDIYYLYVSSNSSMYWGEDILGDEILYYGESITIELPIDSEYPQHDILAEGDSGASYEILNMNLIDQSELTINTEDMTSSGEDYYDDYEYDDYDDYEGYDEYNEAYLEGYREGFKDGWSEAYRQGFEDAMRQSADQ